MEVPKLVPILHFLACFQKRLFGGSFELFGIRAFVFQGLGPYFMVGSDPMCLKKHIDWILKRNSYHMSRSRMGSY